MPNGLWNKADHYRQLVDECVALAKASNSNEIRAEHYATAEYYLHLADVASPTGTPRPRLYQEPTLLAPTH